jgi:hypothetical protein
LADNNSRNTLGRLTTPLPLFNTFICYQKNILPQIPVPQQRQHYSPSYSETSLWVLWVVRVAKLTK